MCRLEGKVAVGTGGRSRIGLAPVRRFAGGGGRRILTGWRRCERDPGVRVVGGVATGVHGNISNLTDRGLPRLARR